MFASVARCYDLLNHLLSLNFDRRWRRLAAREALKPSSDNNCSPTIRGRALSRILDLCAGTGDLALELARCRPGARIAAVDFVQPMLKRGQAKFHRAAKAGQIHALCADAFHLPFRDGSFEALTVAFGLRNIVPVEQALAEAARVVRPGGRLVVLEFSLPRRGLWRRIYGFYFFHILPRIGKWVSGTAAYHYLADSVARFPEPEQFSAMLSREGFTDAQWRPLLGGAVALYTAIVPAPANQTRGQPAEETQ